MSQATEKLEIDSELGTLIVVLLKARNLNDNHSFRKQDVFAQATLNGVQKRSHVNIRGGQHPEWDSETRFTVLKGKGPGGKNRKLEVACYSQEPRSEELLGKATVDISDTLKTGEFDDWVSLDVDGAVRGDIYLEMTYYASKPVPAAAPNNKHLAIIQGSALGRRPSKLSPSDRLSRPIQQNAGPSRASPKQPSELHDQYNPTSSYLNKAVSPISKYGAVLSSTRDLRSLSPPQLAVPSILRPGLGGHSSASEPGRRRDFVHNRTPSEPSISSNIRYSTPPNVPLSQSNPYTGGSGAYTAAHSGLSNIDSPLPYTGDNGAYIAWEQHQQVSGGRSYSPAPPGAFIPQNQPGPDGQSYFPVSYVQTPGPSYLDGASSLNLHTGGSGAFILGVQHLQASGGSYSPALPGAFIPQTYSPMSSVQSFGPSNLDGAISPNPHAGGSGPFVPGVQHRQASGGRSYSPAPPGAFMPQNKPGPDGGSYSTVSSVQTFGPPNFDGAVFPNSYTEISGAFIPRDQFRQASGGQPYSPVSPIIISASPPNSYTKNGGVYLPENQLGPHVPSYTPPSPPFFVQSPRSSNIDQSAPTDSYTGESGAFMPGCQQAPDGQAYTSAPPVNASQASGYANHATTVQAPSSASLPYNGSTGASIAPSGPLAFPMPNMRPGIGERSESSSYYQPQLPPPPTSPVSNVRSEQEAIDTYHLGYQTPLPLPPGPVKENPLPPPLPPPAAPAMNTAPQVSLSPPAVAHAPGESPFPPPSPTPAPTMATPAQLSSSSPAVARAPAESPLPRPPPHPVAQAMATTPQISSSPPAVPRAPADSPFPPPPPPPPAVATPAQVSSSPPAAARAPAESSLPPPPHAIATPAQVSSPPPSVAHAPAETLLPPPPPPPPALAMVTPAQVSSSPRAVTRAKAPNPARVEALRRLEQDAAWRKEQELKDLELAVQLDEELNL